MELEGVVFVFRTWFFAFFSVADGDGVWVDLRPPFSMTALEYFWASLAVFIGKVLTLVLLISFYYVCF